MIASHAFKPAELAMIQDGYLYACPAPMNADATILRDIAEGEEVAIVSFADFRRWHAEHGWNVPGPFKAVSANLRDRMHG